MKPGLEKLKDRLRRAGATIDGTPLCKKCRCPECVRDRSLTSEEKRAEVNRLLATARARVIAGDPEYPVRELREQIADVGFADLLARAGYRLTPIPPQSPAEEPS